MHTYRIIGHRVWHTYATFEAPTIVQASWRLHHPGSPYPQSDSVLLQRLEERVWKTVDWKNPDPEDRSEPT